MHFPREGTLSQKIRLVVGHLLMAAIFIALVALGFGYLVERLWNAILPQVMNVRPLHYWQAVGLLLLCRILVGSFSHRGHSGHNKQKRGCPFSKQTATQANDVSGVIAEGE